MRTFYNISHARASKLACACVEGPGAPGNGANKSGANHPVPRRAPCLQPVMETGEKYSDILKGYILNGTWPPH